MSSASCSSCCAGPIGGATRVVEGRLMATASWAKLDAIAAVRKATVAILDEGSIQTRVGDHQWAPHALHEVLDEGAVHLLALFWAAREPVAFDELYEVALEVGERRLQWAPIVPVESRQRQIGPRAGSLPAPNDAPRGCQGRIVGGVGSGRPRVRCSA
jgi:hypothetical protein